MNTKSEILKQPSAEKTNEKNDAIINSAVIIPALNPMPDLVDFVHRLLSRGIPRVIVINDGSSPSCDETFRRLEQIKRCTVLKHDINRGKGRALKTAFSYFTEHCGELDGVVTADADGQHTVDDICIIASELSVNKRSLVLGERNFKQNNVPMRSYIGNTITSRIFQLLFGYYLDDTQTGLRGIPSTALPWMINIRGERFDYEINMLIKARLHNLCFVEVPIKTVYYNNNSGSHYSTVKDSARIFACLMENFFSYYWAVIVAGLIDITGFFILDSIIFHKISAPARILVSTAIARIISASCKLLLNREFVLSNMVALRDLILRLIGLSLFKASASFGIVYGTSLVWNINETTIKLIVDIVLGAISYHLLLHMFLDRGVDCRRRSLQPL